MIDLKNHYGFTRTPFGKDLAPSMLHRYPAHAEAVARITWCGPMRLVSSTSRQSSIFRRFQRRLLPHLYINVRGRASGHECRDR